MHQPSARTHSNDIYPQAFLSPSMTSPPSSYADDPLVAKLVEFFRDKGLPALKDEDRRAQWYEDWIEFQREQRPYASLLAPSRYSTRDGAKLDLLRLTRFLEAFAYFSPAHGYSLQVTLLGLFCILMGTNDDLKREAISMLEAGGLLGFGISERAHGSDLLGNEFTLRETDSGQLVAKGSKYYIGNANCAAMFVILARKETPHRSGPGRRAPIALLAIRPGEAKAFGNVQKISTMGIRPAFVGSFEVKDHPLPATDIVAGGRAAWDAVFGTITLGKFMLGFGSIGICEHALTETVEHLSARVLYGKPAIAMPHIASTIAQAYARLTAMKLFAYRALDYLQIGSERDRRYLLYCSVQKAKVSVEGVNVIGMLAECIGAKGFESDTYFEMARRDIQLIPSLEGSTHINRGQTAQFIRPYLAGEKVEMPVPGSLLQGTLEATENPYLLDAKTVAADTVVFPGFLDAYRPLMDCFNVRLFVRQAKAFALFIQRNVLTREQESDPEISLALGQFLATIVYGQLIAEHCMIVKLPPSTINALFHGLVIDANEAAIALAALPQCGEAIKDQIARWIFIPRTTDADWKWVSERIHSSARPA